MNRERGSVALIVVGIVLALVLIGFFRSSHSFWNTLNYRTVLRLPCGLSVNAPKKDSRTVFPLTISGYANGCGWEVANGSAGTVQLFDSRGLPVSKPEVLAVESTEVEAPYRFDTKLSLYVPPATDTGQLIFSSQNGLVYAVPVTF